MNELGGRIKKKLNPLQIAGGILSSTRSTFENFEGFKGSKDKTSRKMHPSDDFLQSLGINAQRSDAEHQGMLLRYELMHANRYL